MSNFDMTEQETNQALLHLMLVQEATKRAKERASDKQLKAVTKHVDGKEVVSVGELLSEKEYESLILEIAKEWGVYNGV